MISKLGGINLSCPVSSTPDLKFEEQFQIFQSELIETRESLKILKSFMLEYVLEKEGTLPPGFANYIGANQQLGDENSQAPKHSPMAARKSRTRKSSKGSCSYKRRFRDDDDYLKSV